MGRPAVDVQDYIKEAKSVYGDSSIMAAMHKEAAKMAQFLFSVALAAAE